MILKKIFIGLQADVKQFGSQLGLTFCEALFGSKLFAKVI